MKYIALNTIFKKNIDYYKIWFSRPYCLINQIKFGVFIFIFIVSPQAITPSYVMIIIHKPLHLKQLTTLPYISKI